MKESPFVLLVSSLELGTGGSRTSGGFKLRDEGVSAFGSGFCLRIGTGGGGRPGADSDSIGGFEAGIGFEFATGGGKAHGGDPCREPGGRGHFPIPFPDLLVLSYPSTPPLALSLLLCRAGRVHCLYPRVAKRPR